METMRWEPGRCRGCIRREGEVAVGCGCGCVVCAECAELGVDLSVDWKCALWCIRSQAEASGAALPHARAVHCTGAKRAWRAP